MRNRNYRFPKPVDRICRQGIRNPETGAVLAIHAPKRDIDLIMETRGRVKIRYAPTKKAHGYGKLR